MMKSDVVLIYFVTRLTFKIENHAIPIPTVIPTIKSRSSAETES
jgi:hypothetical protein